MLMCFCWLVNGSFIIFVIASAQICYLDTRRRSISPNLKIETYKKILKHHSNDLGVKWSSTNFRFFRSCIFAWRKYCQKIFCHDRSWYLLDRHKSVDSPIGILRSFWPLRSLLVLHKLSWLTSILWYKQDEKRR